MLNDQSLQDITILYYRFKFTKANKIADEIIELLEDFLSKIDTEISQQNSSNYIFRIIN